MTRPDIGTFTVKTHKLSKIRVDAISTVLYIHMQ